jgi:hypothetical protein
MEDKQTVYDANRKPRYKIGEQAWIFQLDHIIQTTVVAIGFPDTTERYPISPDDVSCPRYSLQGADLMRLESQVFKTRKEAYAAYKSAKTAEAIAQATANNKAHENAMNKLMLSTMGYVYLPPDADKKPKRWRLWTHFL